MFHKIQTCPGTKAKASSKKPAQKDEAAEEESEDGSVEIVDLEDWQSVGSSDEDRRKKSGGKCGKGAGSNQKRKASKVSAEAKATAKKENSSTVTLAKKLQKVFDPVCKEARKALRAAACTEEFKDEAKAALSVLKECNAVVKKHAQATAEGKILASLTMTLADGKELAKAVKDKAEAILQFDKCVNQMGDEGLAKVAERAKARAEAKDVE